MKKLSIILLAIILFVSCNKSGDKKEQSESQGKNDKMLAYLAADKMITNFSNDLKKELISSLNEKGAVGSIEVCRIKAPEIAMTYSNEDVWSIKRVSEKNRNPANVADEQEKNIFRQFIARTDSIPDVISVWQVSDTGKVLLYYKPIRTGQLCLKCHGTSETIDPEVKTALEKFYPDDKATGYEVGDLRGMFVVRMKWPEASVYARQLVSDTSQT
jgi:hypothetical protein